jgi:hypothetical protein
VAAKATIASSGRAEAEVGALAAAGPFLGLDVLERGRLQGAHVGIADLVAVHAAAALDLLLAAGGIALLPDGAMSLPARETRNAASRPASSSFRWKFGISIQA